MAAQKRCIGSWADAFSVWKVSEIEMAEPVRTVEGWYVLHDFRTIDWAAWRRTEPTQRDRMLQQAVEQFFGPAQAIDSTDGASAFFAVAGQQADLLLLHLRPRLDDLLQLELDLAQQEVEDFLQPAYSFISVTEMSQYVAGDATQAPTPEQEAFIKRRLYPALPPWRYLSFYPMNKLRNDGNNWYTLPLDERKALMRAHGTTGRQYAGRVQQMITGAMGYDNFEWGVTLFASDALDLKKIVQEMRFDEVSAKYADFGPFYSGVRLDAQELPDLFAGRLPALPTPRE